MSSSPPNQAPLWQRHAQQWDLIGPPLRPVAEDVAFAAAVLNSLPDAGGDGSLMAILLGVTPELAAILRKTRMLSIDHSFDMVRAIWSRHDMGPRSRAMVADWRALPLPPAVADFVVGDGCYTSLPFPTGHRLMTSEVARVLKPGGRFVIRMFLAPDARETPEAVIADLNKGRIGSFHIFKWRLAMALQPRAEDGIRAADIWTAWQHSNIDPSSLETAFGWPAAVIGTINAYRDANVRLTFPKLAEIRAILDPHFRELDCYVPGYELGARCASLHLVKR